MAEEHPIGERAGKALTDLQIGEVKLVRFNPFDLEDFLEWAGDFGISRGLLLWLFYIALLFVLRLEIPQLPLFALEWLVGLSPIWLPVMLYYAAYASWVWYTQSFYLAGRD